MFRTCFLRGSFGSGSQMLAGAAAGLLCFAACAAAEVRSYNGGPGAVMTFSHRQLAERALGVRQTTPVASFARLNPIAHFANSMFFFQGALNACDLNGNGVVNQDDVNLAISMSLNPATCTANILGPGVCNVVVVQRVINAQTGACVVGNPHTVTLSWVASTSSNVAGYYVFRGAASGGPYTKLNSALATGTSYVDTTVQAGQTYYYVVTAVDTSSNSSVYSNEATAVVPSP